MQDKTFHDSVKVAPNLYKELTELESEAISGGKGGGGSSGSSRSRRSANTVMGIRG